MLLDNLRWCRKSPDNSIQHGFCPLPYAALIELPDWVWCVGNNYVGLFFQAGLPPSEVGESIGGHHHCWNSPILQFGANVATPRCAGTSIPSGGNHHICSIRQIV
jgi:hypothetical protein